jgi:hypothetical protein
MVRVLHGFAFVAPLVALVACAGKQYVPPPEGTADVATASFKAASG